MQIKKEELKTEELSEKSLDQVSGGLIKRMVEYPEPLDPNAANCPVAFGCQPSEKNP